MTLLVKQFAGKVPDVAASHVGRIETLIEEFVDSQAEVALQVEVLPGPEIGVFLPNKVRMPLTDKRRNGDSGYERFFDWFHVSKSFQCCGLPIPLRTREGL